MKLKKYHGIFIAVSLLAGTWPTYGQVNGNAVTKYQSFDSPFTSAVGGWQEMGCRTDGQNFGWTNSSNAGGSPGEIGGSNKRQHLRAAYGDTWDASYGTFTLDDPLTVTGRVATMGGHGNAGIFIGYFNTAQIGGTSGGNCLGLLFSSPSTNSARFDIRFEFADGSGLDANLGWATIYSGQSYRFDYTWNPTGGTGSGEMVMHLYDDVSNTVTTGTYDLGSSDRALGAVFNAFGYNTRSLSSHDYYMTNFLDDLSYTALPGGACQISGSAASPTIVINSKNNPIVSSDYFTVTIPGPVDTNTAVTVDLVSTNPAVAYPEGAPGGTLTVTFPAGRDYLSTNIPIVAVTTGPTLFYLANVSSPACLSTNTYQTAVSVQCPQATLAQATISALEMETDKTLTINVTPGMNSTGPVTVTLASSDPGVSAPQSSSVVFPQGGFTTTNLPISCTSTGVATISITGVTSDTCATYTNNAATVVDVSCSPVTLTPSSTTALPGQNNQSLVVSIPPTLNANSPVSMDITSQNPSVAVPQGGSGGTLALSFPAGGTNVQIVGINAVGLGTTAFVAQNINAAACTTGSSATISVVQSAITNTECQTFDTQSSASAAGWVEDNSRNYRQNYGFSNSGNASGSAGEAGGVFYRTNFLTSYADTSIGTLTLNDYISADGKLFIAKPSTNNADAWVGFFNSTSTGTNTSSQPQSFLGIELSDNGDIANTRFRGMFGDSTGSHVAEVSANPTALLSYFTSYDWNFTYDPTGGPDGYGQMIWNVTIFGAPYSITNNLTVANRENGATFDRFGLINFVRSPRSDADPLEFYVDNLCYTTGGPVKLQNIAFVSANQLQITFTSFGTTHTVQWTPSLSPATWSNVTGVTFNGPSGNNVWTAQFAVPAGGTGFFRVISSP